jgi:ADP-ribosylglycohydrolase
MVPYHGRMAETTGTPITEPERRPLPATYWVVPGRLLVGEHPASRSRADSMDRLRRFLVAGVTCFVDLTEPAELPSYEPLLPLTTPEGRRIEYMREPIRDHDVPADDEHMSQVVDTVDAALEAGHVVYLHCRAGVGRSAMVAACWLASRAGAGKDPLPALQDCWRESSRSRDWPAVPETREQTAFVRRWCALHGRARFGAAQGAAGSVADRVRGALLGLALGDATGAARQRGVEPAGVWTQHTSLTLCLAESLLDTGRCDARDQMQRYLRWQHEGHLSADGQPGTATPDVARALATFQWRKLPMAGSHDPHDLTTAGLPRVLAAAAFAAAEPAAALTLAVECTRTTHQAPVALDACRYLAALLVGALRGADADAILHGVYEPAASLWTTRPLKPQVLAALARKRIVEDAGPRQGGWDVLQALVNARAAVSTGGDVGQAIDAAIGHGREPALDGALAGALAGALQGARGLPASGTGALARLDLLEQFAARLAERGAAGRGP